MGIPTDEVHGIVSAAAHVYHSELIRGVEPDRQAARGFLSDRRVFAHAARSFKLGYAPRGVTGGRPWILSKFPSTPVVSLMAAGVVVETERGLVDPMAGRVVFPQVLPSGKYSGFVGRLLGDGSRKDKYLSTPRTSVFRRSEILYRIDLAQATILQRRAALVVEGPMDAILLWQVGVRHAVAAGTRTLSDAQAQVLARFADRLEIMFDSGEEEYAAFERVRRVRGPLFKDVSWRAVPPPAKDPAEWAARQIDRNLTGV